MHSSSLLSAMQSYGYCRLPNQFTAEFLCALKLETEALIEKYYSKENLEAHSVYPSDTTPTRVSHALMIAEGESPLPKIEHKGYSAVEKLLQEHNKLLSELTGTQVAPSARCMLNFQNYFSGSKPVGEHFDGEYIKAQKAADGIEFRLLEGILPRFVAVLVITNENHGKGTELVDNATGEVFRPEMNPGDLLIFDNVRLRHRVPTMENPRTTIGLRNFDHMAFHFAHSDEYFRGSDYRQIPEGWVSETIDCNQRFAEFMSNEWPALKQEYAHYF